MERAMPHEPISLLMRLADTCVCLRVEAAQTLGEDKNPDALATINWFLAYAVWPTAAQTRAYLVASGDLSDADALCIAERLTLVSPRKSARYSRPPIYEFDANQRASIIRVVAARAWLDACVYQEDSTSRVSAAINHAMEAGVVDCGDALQLALVEVWSYCPPAA